MHFAAFIALPIGSLTILANQQGVRTVPHRVRVRLSRRRNEDEESKSKMYTLVSLVDVADVKGLVTVNVADE